MTKAAPNKYDTNLIGRAYLTHELFHGVEVIVGKVPVSLCDRGHFQTRLRFDDEDMAELTASVKKFNGNYDPVVLRPKLFGRFEIIAGERRVRALMAAGIDDALCQYGNFTDEQAGIICATENLQRRDLDPLEEAENFRTLIETLGVTQQVCSELLSKKRSYIANSLRLLNLDSQVKDLLRLGRIDVGHAKVLAGLKRKAQQRELAHKCARNQWSVKQLTAVIAKFNNPMEYLSDKVEPSRDRDIANLEERISTEICHPCKIHFDRETGAGRFEIHFSGAAAFGGIVERVAPAVDLDDVTSIQLDEEE